MDGQLKSAAHYRRVLSARKKEDGVQFLGRKHVFSVGVLRAWLEGV